MQINFFGCANNSIQTRFYPIQVDRHVVDDIQQVVKHFQFVVAAIALNAQSCINPLIFGN